MPPQPELGVDLDAARGPVREYVAQEPVQREIASRFRGFLRNFQDGAGELVYRHRIRDMCTSACAAACVRGLGDGVFMREMRCSVLCRVHVAAAR